jgi:hypothetical protein
MIVGPNRWGTVGEKCDNILRAVLIGLGDIEGIANETQFTLAITGRVELLRSRSPHP